MPGVVYGLGEENVSVTVSQRELAHILSGGANTLITLKVDGGNQLTLARQIQRHPIKGTYVHVDFIRVRADQTIQAEVPVHLIGESEGVTHGGVLEQLLHTLTVEALPGRHPGRARDRRHRAARSATQIHVARPARVPAGVVILNEADELGRADLPRPRVAEEGPRPPRAKRSRAKAAEGEAGAGTAPARRRAVRRPSG